MGEEGFEPPKAIASRFTACPLWPLGYSPLTSPNQGEYCTCRVGCDQSLYPTRCHSLLGRRRPFAAVRLEKEPPDGLEPSTCGLQNRSSAVTNAPGASENPGSSDSLARLAALLARHPELARVVEGWPRLPEHVRTAIAHLAGGPLEPSSADDRAIIVEVERVGTPDRRCGSAQPSATEGVPG